MSYAAVRAYAATIASGVSLSSGFDLGAAPTRVTLMVPTMASGSDISILYSDVLAGPYYKACTFNSTTGAAVAYNIASSITLVACDVPVCGQFIQLKLTTATTDNSYTFKILCNQ